MAGIFSERAWNKVWLYRAGFLKGLGTTAETALFGLILALVLGILFGLMATSNKKVLRGISRMRKRCCWMPIWIRLVIFQTSGS